MPDALEITPVMIVGPALDTTAIDGADESSTEGSAESDDSSTVGLNEIGFMDGEIVGL